MAAVSASSAAWERTMDGIFKITLLSPVFIGSGFKLSRNIDFYSDSKGTFIIDQDSFIEQLDERQINELTNSRDLVEFAERNKKSLKEFSRKISPLSISAIEINEFLKDSRGLPIIPGSSLKGALRTVIAQHIFKSDKMRVEIHPRTKKEWAFTEMNKRIFGSDPKNDFMHGLLVGDAELKPADLALLMTKVYSLKGQNLAIKLQNYNDPRSEMKIYCEFLKEGSTSCIRFHLDKFFWREKTMAELGIPQSRKDVMRTIPKIANDYALKRLKQENEFYVGHGLTQLAPFFKKTIELVPSLKEESFLLNLGWGTGWKFKTGDYIPENEIDKVRSDFKLGRMDRNTGALVKPFPKSRKILFNTMGSPYAVPGWILLEKSR
jgi:CRISPR-associated protein Csm5